MRNESEPRKAILVIDVKDTYVGKSGKVYQFLLNEKVWVEMKNVELKTARGFFVINNNYYVVGADGIHLLKLCRQYDQSFQQFQALLFPHHTSDKQNITSCQVGDKILTISGPNNHSKLFELADSKSTDANIEIDTTGFAVVEYLNKVWITGGRIYRTYEDDLQNDWEFFNSIQVYDPVSNSQEQSEIKMVWKRAFHSCVVYNRQLFIFGGLNENNDATNRIERYNPYDNEFSIVGMLKHPRYKFSCVRVGNLVYVMGGLDNRGQPLSSVEVFNLDDTWLTSWFVKELPFERRRSSLCTACVIDRDVCSGN